MNLGSDSVSVSQQRSRTNSKRQLNHRRPFLKNASNDLVPDDDRVMFHNAHRYNALYPMPRGNRRAIYFY